MDISLGVSFYFRTWDMKPEMTRPKRHCFNMNYNSSFIYEKECDLLQGRIMDQALNAISYLGVEALRPLVHTPPAPTTEMGPVMSSLYPIPLTRNEMPNGARQDLDKSHLLKEKQQPSERGLSPNQSGQDSTDSDSNHEERPGHGFPLPSYPIAPRGHNGLPPLKEIPGPYAGAQPPLLASAREAFKVTSRDGEVLGVYRCDHCRVLFLDYVMFTIHMGCHGFRDPFECNMCGYRSHDRYEFSSHIARGEHRPILK